MYTVNVKYVSVLCPLSFVTSFPFDFVKGSWDAQVREAVEPSLRVLDSTAKDTFLWWTTEEDGGGEPIGHN